MVRAIHRTRIGEVVPARELVQAGAVQFLASRFVSLGSWVIGYCRCNFTAAIVVYISHLVDRDGESLSNLVLHRSESANRRSLDRFGADVHTGWFNVSDGNYSRHQSTNTGRDPCNRDDSNRRLVLDSVANPFFWSIFLWILPMGINELLGRIGWSSFVHSRQVECALTLLIVASAGGLWSGWTIASHGKGTPLPTATAVELVVAGPYRFVRNPMALTGVLQGVAVGWLLGSFPLIAGALLCGFIWHLLVRPVEESDLHARFGASYVAYQQAVGLWIPSFR